MPFFAFALCIRTLAAAFDAFRATYDRLRRSVSSLESGRQRDRFPRTGASRRLLIERKAIQQNNCGTTAYNYLSRSVSRARHCRQPLAYWIMEVCPSLDSIERPQSCYAHSSPMSVGGGLYVPIALALKAQGRSVATDGFRPIKVVVLDVRGEY